jgi:hypothetical protein
MHHPPAAAFAAEPSDMAELAEIADIARLELAAWEAGAVAGATADLGAVGDLRLGEAAANVLGAAELANTLSVLRTEAHRTADQAYERAVAAVAALRQARWMSSWAAEWQRTMAADDGGAPEALAGHGHSFPEDPVLTCTDPPTGTPVR